MTENRARIDAIKAELRAESKAARAVQRAARRPQASPMWHEQVATRLFDDARDTTPAPIGLGRDTARFKRPRVTAVMEREFDAAYIFDWARGRYE